MVDVAAVDVVVEGVAVETEVLKTEGMRILTLVSTGIVVLLVYTTICPSTACCFILFS